MDIVSRCDPDHQRYGTVHFVKQTYPSRFSRSLKVRSSSTPRIFVCDSSTTFKRSKTNCPGAIGHEGIHEQFFLREKISIAISSLERDLLGSRDPNELLFRSGDYTLLGSSMNRKQRELIDNNSTYILHKLRYQKFPMSRLRSFHSLYFAITFLNLHIRHLPRQRTMYRVHTDILRYRERRTRNHRARRGYPFSL